MSHVRSSLSPDEFEEGEKVVELLNCAKLVTPAERVDILLMLKEIVVWKSNSLLSKFVSHILAFASDSNPAVKKCIVSFIEDVCKKDESQLPVVLFPLQVLLCDQNVHVQKKVISSVHSIYKAMLNCLCKMEHNSRDLEKAWNIMNNIKSEIVNMIDSDNDGIRSAAVLFLEMVVLLQTYPDHNNLSDTDADTFYLEKIPLTIKFVRRRKLEEEANNMFDLLLNYFGSAHISSANLMICMRCLCNIAKQRPHYFEKVIIALDALNRNLPPTLSDSQRTSIRKQLRILLSNLIKSSFIYDRNNVASDLLITLGMSQNDIAKLISGKKRPWNDGNDDGNLKKFKSDTIAEEVLVDDEDVIIEQDELEIKAIDCNAQFIKSNMNINIMMQLILNSIHKVPNEIPVTFVPTILPILSNRNDVEKKFNNFFAIQLLQAQESPGYKYLLRQKNIPKIEPDDLKENIIQKFQGPRVKSKVLRLSEITKPLSIENRNRFLIVAIQRILNSNTLLESESIQKTFYKILINFAAFFNPTVREMILKYLLNNLSDHIELAFSWLYEEYSIMQGFIRYPFNFRHDKPTRNDQNYNSVLCALIGNYKQFGDDLLIRILFEAPLITDEALNLIKTHERFLSILKDLLVRRPVKRVKFLDFLLKLTIGENIEFRDNAIEIICDLYRRKILHESIDNFAKSNLRNLDENNSSLHLFLSLIPYNERLIHKLANIYVSNSTSSEDKRNILRLLDKPMEQMSPESKELLKFIETCPKGTESLVIKILHIVIADVTPNSQLVERVRELYNSRMSDVRLFVPVVIGLQKREIIELLPKLLKSTPVVVSQLIKKLCQPNSPILPTELLIILHSLDKYRIEIKSVIKAISTCLLEKNVFTQEVVAIVIQKLADEKTIPTLLMRTIIQSLSTHPKIMGFVMNILQRLIVKEVWKQKIIWEGFIKCCERTVPQCVPVMLQLPVEQLSEICEQAYSLKTAVKQYVNGLNDSQLGNISKPILDFVKKVKTNDLIKEIKLEKSDLMEPKPPGMD